ncbi:symplekin isoform X2 [Tanacetum coccineum]
MSFRSNLSDCALYHQTHTAKPIRPYAADEQVDFEDDNAVDKIPFDIDEDRYDLFMGRLIVLISVNRNQGYVRVNLKASRTNNKVIGIFIRKKSLYVVAIHDGVKLYEIGTSDYQAGYFKNAYFTEYGEMYQDLFTKTNRSLYGIELGRRILRYSFEEIVYNVGDCKRWRYSSGIFAMMISEPARFVWILDILIDRMERKNGHVILSDEYKWIAWLPTHWGKITRVAKWEPRRNETIRHQEDTHSNKGAFKLLGVRMWAWRALIFLYVDCKTRGNFGGASYGGSGRADGDGAQGGGFDRAAARSYASHDYVNPHEKTNLLKELQTSNKDAQ